MSGRKIEAALKRKGIEARKIEFVRGIPTPSGYAQGWDIEITEDTEDEIWKADKTATASEYMEFDNFSQVMEWIYQLPDLSAK